MLRTENYSQLSAFLLLESGQDIVWIFEKRNKRSALFILCFDLLQDILYEHWREICVLKATFGAALLQVTLSDQTVRSPD